jgi:phosphonopyruvate decarboxylase
MMRRDHCLEILARHHGDEIVVAAYQAAFEWLAIKPGPLNFVSTGAMGQASSHGLGFALGRPDKRVIVLDGDGSLLMNLGSLVTIANAAPPNLIHMVCQNGTYEANGGHPIPGQGVVDFADLARAAGYASVFEVDRLDDWEARAGSIIAESGPVFVELKVSPGAEYPQDFATLHSLEQQQQFRQSLREDSV